MSDWLISTALDAVAKERPELAGWCASKKTEEADRDRLGALRFVCNGLDERNRAIAAKAIGVSDADLEACARVLKAI